MIKRYLTIGLAMACFVGKAESVKVICHVVSEDGNPVTVPFSSYCNYKDSADYGAVRVAGDDEYLVFRTRIVKDDNGNIVSANYGKIYGAIRTVGFFGATAIYFNPTPNDVNLEERQ